MLRDPWAEPNRGVCRKPPGYPSDHARPADRNFSAVTPPLGKLMAQPLIGPMPRRSVQQPLPHDAGLPQAFFQDNLLACRIVI